MELEFGTAGIRAIVGNNSNQLNEAHAARIFSAFAKYINQKYKDVENKSIVIGRDNRVRGKRFARLAANILTSNNIKVYFDDNMLATPFISCMIRYKNSLGGINITASHNPKEYNGIKLYNKFGYQMLPDEIIEVKKYFDDYEKYLEYIDKEVEIIKSNLIIDINNDDINYYVDEVLSLNKKKQDISNIKIIYSSLHGTGYQYVKNIFDKLNANIIYEKNEIIEDENFSYVENPNPEYEIAYKNTIKLANENNADLILVTDPDSDRVGVAYKDGNEFKLINGNENAILITDYLINNKNKNINDYYLVYSFVSTSLPSKMCKLNNIKSYVTETGFKWIGKTITELENKETFFFAFEESYGSLVNNKISLDKDAIQSVLMIALIASEAKKQNMNLKDKLESIYSQYGYMQAKSFSFDLKSKEQLEQIKSKFKDIEFDNATFIDYSKGRGAVLPNDMLAYEFNNSSNWVSLRPSGTEPKFKIYIHVVEETNIKSKQIFDELFNIIKTKLEL